MNLTRLNDIPRAKSGVKKLTPAHYPFPVFALCPPVYADNAIQNNVTMKEHQGEKIDRDKFLAQWYNMYGVLAANSLVYLITPKKGLQDQTYVNCAVYLPHLKDRDVMVLSNFTAEGRAGEEDVAGRLFKDLGYEVFDCPFKFEGYPELKWLKNNIYLGGYGQRTDIKALQWIEKQFGAKVIPIKETDKTLYHLDCSAFVFNEYNVMLAAEIMDRPTVAQIEKITNVIPVSRQDAYEGICNSIKVDDAIYNSSPLMFMKETDGEYQAQKHKNETLERICRDLGQELTYFDLSECEKSGAKASCFCMPMNAK